MEIGAARAVVFERDGGAIGDIERHFRLVQRIPLELTLESGGVESIAAAGPIKQFEMDVEEEGVDGQR